MRLAASTRERTRVTHNGVRLAPMQLAARDHQNMKIVVLGSGGRASAAGTGRRQCDAARASEPNAAMRLPGSIAVTGDGHRWLLLNAAPDLTRHPHIEVAAAAIAGVVLLDAQPDRVEGLLGLRDGPPLDLYATPGVFEELTNGLALLDQLDTQCGVRWHLLPVAGDTRSAEFRIEGMDTLRLHAIDTGGRAAPYSPHRREAVVGDSVALLIEDRNDGRRLFYSPDTPGDSALPWMDKADCLLVNGSRCRFDTSNAHVDDPHDASLELATCTVDRLRGARC
jgi:pyrroloquinoline quinone biosynthesis protein B